MPRTLAPRRLAAAFACLTLTLGLGTAARADFAYGFAEQTISGLSVVPGAGTIMPTVGVTSTSVDGSTYNGSGLSNSDPAGRDAVQSFSGPAPKAPENDFLKWATFPVGTATPIPAGTAPNGPGTFGRGDSLIASLSGPANSASVVGEAYVNGVGSTTGNGGASASFSFTLSSATTLGLSYTYSNDAYVATGGPLSAATASYNFNITVKDAIGNVVFDSDTPNTNLSLVAPPQGGEIIRTGMESVTTGTLLAGTDYTLIFSIKAAASAEVRAVPEPGSLALLASGGLGLTAYARRFRRKALALA